MSPIYRNVTVEERDRIIAKMDKWVKCPNCDGTGEVHSHNPRCWECGGRGKISPAQHGELKESEERNLRWQKERDVITEYVKDRLWRDDDFRKRMLKEALKYTAARLKADPTALDDVGFG